MLSRESNVIRVLQEAVLYLPKFMDRLVVKIGYLGSILTLVMVLAIVYDVVLRFFFNRPTMWANDLVQYLLICVTLLLAAWVLREEGHVKVDIIVRLFKPRAQAFINCVTGVLIIAACAIFCWQSAKSTWADYKSGIMTGYSLDIPRFMVIMIIAIGSLLLLFQTIRRFQGHLKKFIAILRTKKDEIDGNSP